jgi:hypothetical protein
MRYNTRTPPPNKAIAKRDTKSDSPFDLTTEFYITEERVRVLYDDVGTIKEKLSALEIIIHHNKLILDGLKRFTWIVMGASASVFISLLANKVL